MDQDTLDKIASGEYSISPRTGRLRKKIKKKRHKPFFQRSGVKKKMTTVIWILLIVGFIISLIVVLPELEFDASKKNDKIEKVIGR